MELVKYPALVYDIRNNILVAVRSAVLHQAVYSTEQFRLATKEERDSLDYQGK